VFRRTLLLIVLTLAALHGNAQESGTLKIAAAADMKPVLPTLIHQFEQQTHKKVEASYASSATLATQIINGGPFGLFLAADLSFPQKVIAAGLGDSAEPVPYARGTLVLWARNNSPIQPLSMNSLRNPSLKTVAVANPEHAPYGRAAKAAIEKLGLTATLQSKLVVAENIAQTAQYADSGNAEVGFLSLTSALTPRLISDGKYVAVPENSYPPLLQGAVVIKNTPGAGEAHQFLDFLLSAPIRKQLAERGLKAP
jgi:molybdate transport system substrate-binding protein